MRKGRLVLALAGALVGFGGYLVLGGAWAQPTFTAAEQALVNEHVAHGLPGTDGTILVRTAYVVSYDETMRIPMWVAYHVAPEYLDTPNRSGRFSSYRADPDLTNEAKDGEYTGLSASRGLVRGHLARRGHSARSEQKSMWQH